MKLRLATALLLSPLAVLCDSFDHEELVVNLKNPSFIDGQLYTEEGGVVSGSSLRIQAQKISYHTTLVDGMPQRVVTASGDLFVVFKDKPFVAESITYDFISGKGVLYDGRTYVDLWYLGGDEIILNPDGSFEAKNAFITTSANRSSSWEFHSKTMKVNKKRTLSVKNMSLRLFRIPVFWMPAFKASLRFAKDPMIKYKVTWDKGIGPRLTARYQFFSNERFDMYLRADMRVTPGEGHSIKTAYGGAIETMYKDPSHRTQFLTRSFYANDKVVHEERGPHRYRFQGLFKHQPEDEKSLVYLSYDKLSDQPMITDFKSDDFVVNTEKRSYLYVYKQAEDVMLRFSVQPCLNRFQSITEELPKLLLNLRSQDLGKTGLIANSDSSVAYLNYKYARGLTPYFKTYNAFRMQTINELYRPINLGGFTITPKLGVIGIYYNNGPIPDLRSQLAYNYSILSNMRIAATHAHFTHVLEPYIDYSGYSKPWIGPDAHYYFYLDDGLVKLNFLKAGLRQSFNMGLRPRQLMIDLFAQSYFKGLNFPEVIGKYGINIEFYDRRYFLKSYFQYNVGETTFDYFNIQGAYTVSKDFALSLEYRTRGPYAYRKGDYENYFLDVGRPNSELIQTPISDKRQTILGKAMLRLSPRVNMQVAGHYGYGRKNEPSYTSTKVDLNFSIGGSWNLKLGYQHSPDNDRFTTNFYLTP